MQLQNLLRYSREWTFQSLGYRYTGTPVQEPPVPVDPKLSPELLQLGDLPLRVPPRGVAVEAAPGLTFSQLLHTRGFFLQREVGAGALFFTSKREQNVDLFQK